MGSNWSELCAIRPREWRNRVVVVAVRFRICGAEAVHEDVRVHPCASAEHLSIGVVAFRAVGIGVIGEGGLVEHARIIQALDIGQPIFPCLRVGDGIDLAVVQNQESPVIVIGEGIHQIGNRSGAVIHCRAAQHLIGLAIAICVLLLESDQHVLEVFGRHRRGDVQFLQPGGVDPHLIREGAVVALDELRYSPNIAIRSCSKRFEIREFFQCRFDIGRILIDQVVEREDHALLPVLEQVNLRKLIDPGDQHEQIRIVTAGKRQVTLLRGIRVVVSGGRPIELDVEHLLQRSRENVGRQIPVGRLGGENVDGDGFRLRRSRHNHKQHREYKKEQNKQSLFHYPLLPFLI